MAALASASSFAGPAMGTGRWRSASASGSPSLRVGSTANPRRRNRAGIRCTSTGGSPEPGSSENESKVILDAFFLGKAFAEALNERIESTVGEVLSVVGQWQAEQQKQVLDFQDEVIERAKKAKERAALEAKDGNTPVEKSLNGNGSSSSSSSSSSYNNGSTSGDPFQEAMRDD